MLNNNIIRERNNAIIENTNELVIVSSISKNRTIKQKNNPGTKTRIEQIQIYLL